MKDDDPEQAPRAADGEERARAMPLEGEAAGDRIGRFTLRRTIGAGGFGTVWLAEQSEPIKREVALKILKLGMDTAEVVSRFEAERQALALMDHPGIAKVHDGGATAAGRPYLVMELVDGVPITQFCTERDLGLVERLELFERVCHAIQHAHTKGVVHRDVKPSNVLVSIDDDGIAVPKVIDFGIAKAMGARLGEHTLVTGEFQIIGTPEYMAPEQLATDGRGIDTRVDVYALGVLLYELLTGVLPLDLRAALRDGFDRMLRTIREEDPPKPSTRAESRTTSGDGPATGSTTRFERAELAGDLDWIVLKALEKDPERRYGTASELAADVRNHLEDRPVEARPPSRTYVVSKFVRRHRVQVAGAVAVLVALVAGVIGTSVGLVWAVEEQERANLAAGAERDAKDEALALAERLDHALGDAESQRDRAERELERAVEIKSLLGETLLSVDPNRARGVDTTLLRGVLDGVTERLRSGSIADPLVELELCAIVAGVSSKIGDEVGALAVVQGTVDRLEGVVPIDLDVWVELQFNRAALLEYLGRYAEAWDVVETYVPVAREVFGPGSSTYASLAMLRAELLVDLGNAADGVAYGEATVEELRERLGDDARVVRDAEHSLSRLVARVGRHREGLESLERYYRDELATSGPEASTTLRALADLLYARVSLGRAGSEELALAESLLERSARIHGEDSSKYGIAANVLAAVHAERGEMARAVELQRRAVELASRHEGVDTPTTLAVRSTLGLFLYRSGNWDEARTILSEVLEDQRRVEGELATNTLTTANILGSLMQNLGELEAAAELFVACLDGFRAAGIEESQVALGTLTNLGDTYNDLGRYEEARACLERSLEAKRRTLGPDHPWLRIALTELQIAYEGLGDTESAVRCLGERIDFLERRASRPDVRALDLMQLIEAYTDGGGAFVDVERMLDVAHQLIELPDAKPLEASTYLARTLRIDGRLAEACEVLSDALEAAGPDDPDRPWVAAALERYEEILRSESD